MIYFILYACLLAFTYWTIMGVMLHYERTLYTIPECGVIRTWSTEVTTVCRPVDHGATYSTFVLRPRKPIIRAALWPTDRHFIFSSKLERLSSSIHERNKRLAPLISLHLCPKRVRCFDLHGHHSLKLPPSEPWYTVLEITALRVFVHLPY